MNAQLANEEESKRKKDMKSRQEMYREQLSEQLKDKEINRRKDNRENNMW